MSKLPDSVSDFLSGKRIAVTGVSRQANQAANAVFRKLKKSGFEVFAVNPNASEVEGVKPFLDIRSLPDPIDGVVVASHPRTGLEIVRQCAEKKIQNVWFHRAFGDGSASDDAVNECQRLGIKCIVGGCPLMYCAPVDAGHQCMRWILGLNGRVPIR
ncbi:MAG: CoA-binding protein [Alphaproteobacteria bacterium]|nr:CoA-binding protein [Alphaproteobacteria bacterium]